MIPSSFESDGDRLLVWPGKARWGVSGPGGSRLGKARTYIMGSF